MESPKTKILQPYRARIDAIDAEIIKLLRQRYDVIEEVGEIKTREGIIATLPDRVEEVRENAAAMAEAAGLDADFIRVLYALLIKHSCELEEKIITANAADAARKQQAS